MGDMLVADRDRSLAATWHALCLSSSDAQLLTSAAPSVGRALLNARYYNSTQGQFLTEDPIFLSSSQNLQDPQSLNAYAYSQDNPITKEDPNGRFSVGVNYNGNLEGGFGAYSATYASANLNFVVNPATWQAWIVQSNSGAVNSGYMNNYESAPDNGKPPFVLGLFGGGAFAVNFAPNTNDPNDIQGTADSINVNVPLVSFSEQNAGTENPTYSVAPGVKGLASVSRYPVYTQITNTYSVNQAVSRVTSQVANYYQAAVASIQTQINNIQSQINSIQAQINSLTANSSAKKN
jgi:RHS repeat-associated protein